MKKIMICGVSAVALAGCMGEGEDEFRELIERADALQSDAFEADFVIPPESGTAEFEGFATYVQGAGETVATSAITGPGQVMVDIGSESEGPEITFVAVGSMTTTIDFDSQTIDGTASNFYEVVIPDTNLLNEDFDYNTLESNGSIAGSFTISEPSERLKARFEGIPVLIEGSITPTTGNTISHTGEDAILGIASIYGDGAAEYLEIYGMSETESGGALFLGLGQDTTPLAEGDGGIQQLQ